MLTSAVETNQAVRVVATMYVYLCVAQGNWERRVSS